MFLKKIFKLIWVSALIALSISVINFVTTGSLNSWPDEIEAYLTNFVFSICITAVNFGFLTF